MEWGGGAGEERGSKMDVITTSTLSGFLEEFICSENFYCRFCLFCYWRREGTMVIYSLHLAIESRRKRTRTVDYSAADSR